MVRAKLIAKVMVLLGATVLRVIDLQSLAPQRCEFKFHQELWVISCEEAIQLT